MQYQQEPEPNNPCDPQYKVQIKRTGTWPVAASVVRKPLPLLLKGPPMYPPVHINRCFCFLLWYCFLKIATTEHMVCFVFLKLCTAVLQSHLLMGSLSVRQVDSSTVLFAGLVTEDIGLLERALLFVGNLPMDIMHGMCLSLPVKVNSYFITYENTLDLCSVVSLMCQCANTESSSTQGTQVLGPFAISLDREGFPCIKRDFHSALLLLQPSVSTMIHFGVGIPRNSTKGR